MNVIRKAVDDVKFRIPREVLEKAFLPYNAYGRVYNNVSLDEQIINNVIKARVLPDCNIVGGIQALVPLDGLPVDLVNTNMISIHIPKERTQGRSVLMALSVVFINSNSATNIYGVNGVSGNNSCTPSLLTAANGLLKSFDSIPSTSTSRVQLISENTILVKEMGMIPSNSFLRCELSNDEEMANIPIRAYRYISKMVELAVKAYVYNELIIKIDMGQLQGGANIGMFKQIIEGYSDAEQNYQDYVEETIQQVLFTADTEKYARYLKLIVGGNR